MLLLPLLLLSKVTVKVELSAHAVPTPPTTTSNRSNNLVSRVFCLIMFNKGFNVNNVVLIVLYFEFNAKLADISAE